MTPSRKFYIISDNIQVEHTYIHTYIRTYTSKLCT